jgi:hypothetical protein
MKLIDLVFSCGLAGVMAAIAIPSVHGSREHHAPRLAARYLANRLRGARIEALRRSAHVALRFDPDDLGRLRLFADGDGDGVRQSDIEQGIDPPIGGDEHLSDFFESFTLRIRDSVPAPEGGGTLAAGDDPVKLGSSDLLSFNPLGSATSGTLYLAGPSGPQIAIRVLGATGRIRVLWFDMTDLVWRDD